MRCATMVFVKITTRFLLWARILVSKTGCHGKNVFTSERVFLEQKVISLCVVKWKELKLVVELP